MSEVARIAGRCEHGFLLDAGLCTECPAAARPTKKARNRGDAEACMVAGTYVCRGPCGREKPIGEFYVSRTTKLGHQSRCKDCDNEKRRRRQRRRP